MSHQAKSGSSEFSVGQLSSVIPAEAGIQVLTRVPHTGLAGGFVFSIKSSFQRRFHSLMAFSRCMAESMDSCTSYQTNACTPYRLVKPSISPCLCTQTRVTRFDVTPTYRVPLRPLARRYTHGCFMRAPSLDAGACPGLRSGVRRHDDLFLPPRLIPEEPEIGWGLSTRYGGAFRTPRTSHTRHRSR